MRPPVVCGDEQRRSDKPIVAVAHCIWRGNVRLATDIPPNLARIAGPASIGSAVPAPQLNPPQIYRRFTATRLVVDALGAT